jgi:phosphoglycolate phosphatase
MALLFDLDGTLTDSAEGITRSINSALRRFGLPERDDRELRAYIGPPLVEIFSSLIPDAEPIEIGRAIAFFRERYFEIGWKENKPYPGTLSMLLTLSDMGHQLLVCTTKREDMASQILEHFRLSSLFSSIHGCGTKLSKQKLISTMLSKSICPKDSWMIGDRASDIAAGKANQLRTAAVTWGYGTWDELSAAGPDIIIDSPESLCRTRFL